MGELELAAGERDAESMAAGACMGAVDYGRCATRAIGVESRGALVVDGNKMSESKMPLPKSNIPAIETWSSHPASWPGMWSDHVIFDIAGCGGGGSGDRVERGRKGGKGHLETEGGLNLNSENILPASKEGKDAMQLAAGVFEGVIGD